MMLHLYHWIISPISRDSSSHQPRLKRSQYQPHLHYSAGQQSPSLLIHTYWKFDTRTAKKDHHLPLLSFGVDCWFVFNHFPHLDTHLEPTIRGSCFWIEHHLAFNSVNPSKFPNTFYPIYTVLLDSYFISLPPSTCCASYINYEHLCTHNNVTTDAKKVHSILQYCFIHVQVIIQGMPHYFTLNWDAFKRDLLKYFDADFSNQCFQETDLRRFVFESMDTPISSLHDFRAYNRDSFTLEDG